MKVPAYRHFAEVYDLICTPPYEEWVSFIQSVFLDNNFKPKTILDLACGTGNLSVLLARRYKLIGIDLSADMLKIAKEKAKKESLKISFKRGDMRDFRLENKVDCVVCMFDSLNYLLEEKDLKKAFAAVRRALDRKGAFIFDMNSAYSISFDIARLNLCKDLGKYILVWKNTAKDDVWTAKLTLFPKDKEGVMYTEEHKEKAYSLSDIKRLLAGAGFNRVRAYASPQFDKVDKLTKRYFFVCWK